MLNLITNRTAQDVARWKELHDKGWDAMTPEEQSEWLAGMKGAYKHTDMNRVESAVQTLAARFAERGVVLSLTVKTNWTRTDWPQLADMKRYYLNVETLLRATGVNLPVPTPPTAATRLNYEVANNLEKILLGVERWLDSSEESHYYANEIYAGEV